MAAGKALARCSGMAVQWEHVALTASERVERDFRERVRAEEAVAMLHSAGFAEDEVRMHTHGGRHLEDGTFLAGGVVVVVMTSALRAREAERLLT